MIKIENMNVHTLSALIKDNASIQLIDVREPFEREICHIGGLHIPLSTLSDALGVLDKEKSTIVYCKSGGRSMQACHQLAAAGFNNVANLEGGILRWIQEIDSTLSVY